MIMSLCVNCPLSDSPEFNSMKERSVSESIYCLVLSRWCLFWDFPASFGEKQLNKSAEWTKKQCSHSNQSNFICTAPFMQLSAAQSASQMTDERMLSPARLRETADSGDNSLTSNCFHLVVWYIILILDILNPKKRDFPRVTVSQNSVGRYHSLFLLNSEMLVRFYCCP